MIGKKWWLVPALAVAAFLGGCKPSEEIRTYTVEQAPERVEPTKPEVPAGEARYRFLGAIIPAGEGTYWFVRFFGPINVVSPHEADFDKFLTSIRIGGPAGLSWAVPGGWKLGPPKQMRLTTIQNGQAEIYISDPISGTVLENVNRWRSDFTGLGKVTEAELPGVTVELQLGTTKVYRVDFRGPGGPSATGGMRPPFMGKK